MENRIFDKKERVTTLKGDRILGLLGKSVDAVMLSTLSDTWHFVLPDQASRLDKVLDTRYRDVLKPASFMYYNEMFNPFALEKEEILGVPYIYTNEEYYVAPVKYSRPKKDGSQKTSSKIKKAADILINSVSSSASNKENNAVNVLSDGQAAKVVNGNLITLGGNSL